MMKVFTYVIATDRGVAPNLAAPGITLTICKPKIRLSAQAGDLVLAFNGSGLGASPHGVRWAGVVTDKLSLTDYWNDERFATKKPGACATPDNIYEPSGLGFRQIPNASHGPDQQRRDVSGCYALAFLGDDAWYFGNQSPELPARFGLRMEGGRRAHRVFFITPDTWYDLRQWLNVQPRPSILKWGQATRGSRDSTTALPPPAARKGRGC